MPEPVADLWRALTPAALLLQVRFALEVMFEGVCGTAAAGGVQSLTPGQQAEQGQVLRVSWLPSAALPSPVQTAALPHRVGQPGLWYHNAAACPLSRLPLPQHPHPLPAALLTGQVGDAVTVTYKEGGGKAGVSSASAPPLGPHVVLEWQGGSEADMVADAVVAIILQVGLAGLISS